MGIYLKKKKKKSREKGGLILVHVCLNTEKEKTKQRAEIMGRHSEL